MKIVIAMMAMRLRIRMMKVNVESEERKLNGRKRGSNSITDIYLTMYTPLIIPKKQKMGLGAAYFSNELLAFLTILIISACRIENILATSSSPPFPTTSSNSRLKCCSSLAKEQLTKT